MKHISGFLTKEQRDTLKNEFFSVDVSLGSHFISHCMSFYERAQQSLEKVRTMRLNTSSTSIIKD